MEEAKASDTTATGNNTTTITNNNGRHKQLLEQEKNIAVFDKEMIKKEFPAFWNKLTTIISLQLPNDNKQLFCIYSLETQLLLFSILYL